MKTKKRIVAWLLALTMVFTLYSPVTASAEEVTTEAVTEVTMEETTTEATTEAVTEVTTEEKTTEATTEAVTEATTETTTEVTTEAVKEAATETVSEEMDPVDPHRQLYCNEVTEVYEKPDPDSAMLQKLQEGDEITVIAQSEHWYEIRMEERTGYVERKDGRYSTKQQISTFSQPKMLAAKAVEDYPPTGTVLSAGSFNGGIIWYVYQGPRSDQQRHYVFCLNHGMTMKSGMYSFKKESGTISSKSDTFRIAVAMDYFKAHGGWSSDKGYETAQWVVWNQNGNDTAKKLIAYANHLWKLSEVNSGKSSGSSSYKGVTAIKKSEAATAYKKSITTARMDANAGGYTVNDRTVDIKGSAWKYFASGANGWGSISVEGIYLPDGKKAASNVAKASVQSNGKLKVSFNSVADSYGDSASRALTVVMKVNTTYEGSTSIDYLDCGSGKQKMSFDASFSSPAYFAVKVYTAGKAPGSVRISKVDENGDPVNGAVFTLSGVDEDGVAMEDRSITVTEDVNDNIFEITKPGSYQLMETMPAPGMSGRGDRWFEFKAENKVIDGINKIILTNETDPQDMEGVTLTQSADHLEFTYTIPNDYTGGYATLQKLGEIFSKWENGKFVYEERKLDKVTFALYTAEDIYLGDKLLWKADTEVTQKILDSDWNKKDRYGNVELVTQNGEAMILINNIPLGSYYLIETGNAYNDVSPGYGVFGTRIDFTLTTEHTYENPPLEINGNGKYYNRPILAHCTVMKVDQDKKREDGGSLGEEGEEYGKNVPLAGAEFTLYAHVKNTNYDGMQMFSVADTEPAVTQRVRIGDELKEVTAENEWVPLKTAVSDSSGVADFDLEIPYGKYMVVETKAPKGYALSAGESYVFEHHFDSNDEYSNGKTFTHIFTDIEKGNFIAIHKTGSVLTGAKNASSDHGEYQKLKYETLALKNIRFEIYDEEDNLVETLTTDDKGYAVSSSLPAGTYTVKETYNGGTLKLDPEPQVVTISENEQKIIQMEDVDFYNEALTTKLKLYKQAEKAEYNAGHADNESSSGSLYSYDTIPVAGVVFGIYAKEDIRAYDGSVAVKAGSCLGYTTTGSDGAAVFTDKLPSGSYYFKEIRTADDSIYEPDGSEHEFRIALKGEDITMDLNKDDPVINRLCKGSIRVIKQGDDKKKTRLAGVKFTLFDGNKQEIGHFVTDENGEISITELPVGSYYLQETETQKGYILDDRMREIDLTKSNLTQVLKITNKKEKGTWITIRTNTTFKGHGGVQTGDVMAMLWRFLAMMMAGCMAVYLTLKKRKMPVPVKNVKRAVSWKKTGLMMLIMCCIWAVPGKAEAAGYKMKLQQYPDWSYDSSSSDSSTYYGYVEVGNLVYIITDSQGNPEKINISRTSSPTQLDVVCEYLALAGKTAKAGSAGVTVTLPEYLTIDAPDGYTFPGEKDSREGRVIGVMFDAPGIFSPGGGGNTTNMHITYAAESTCGVFGILGYTESILWQQRLADLAGKINTTASPLSGTTVEFKAKEKIEDSFLSYLIKSKYPESATIKNAFYKMLKVYYNDKYDALLKSKGITTQSYYTGSIQYVLNGGSNPSGAASGYTINGSQSLPTPQRKDYRFAGWYTTADFKLGTDLKSLTAKETAEAKVTLYARWIFEAYTTLDGITYRLDADGTAYVSAAQTTGRLTIADSVTYGGKKYPVIGILAGAFKGCSLKSLTIPAGVYSSASGAFTDSTIDTVTIKSMTLNITDLNKNVNIQTYSTAAAGKNYKANGYTGNLIFFSSPIRYVLNGGTNAAENPDVYLFKTALTFAAPTRAGYRFDGWYTDSAFQASSKLDGIFEDEYKDITLYAKWTALGASEPDKTEEDKTTESKPEKDPGKKTETTTETNRSTTTGNVTKPGKPVLKTKAGKGAKLKVTVKGKADGYEIQYSTSKKFKKAKKKMITATTCTIKLKKGKTYYIRCRGYNLSGKKKLAGKWSKVKKVKIKKEKK